MQLSDSSANRVRFTFLNINEMIFNLLIWQLVTVGGVTANRAQSTASNETEVNNT